MSFGRKKSTSSQQKDHQGKARSTKPPSDGRRSFSDVIQRKSTEFGFRKSHDSGRPRTSEKHATGFAKGLPSTTSWTTVEPLRPRPSCPGRYSEDVVRTSTSARSTARPSEDTIRASMQQRRDGSGEFRTIKGESLSLFPKPIVDPLPSPISLRSRASMDSDYSHGLNMYSKRMVPERLAEGIRSSKRRLKHSASKLSLVSSVDESDEPDKSRVLKTTCGVHGPRRCQCETGLNCRISEPLDFRHVTHALPQQFPNLPERNHSDLVADFSAVRASQISRLELRGIKAQDLSPYRSSFDITPSPTRSNAPSLVSSSSHDSLQSTRPSSRASQDSFGTRRSKENFSRPFFNVRQPRIESLSAPRSLSSSPSFRSFSKPFYASSLADSDVSSEESMKTVHIVHALSPLEELTWELNQWSPAFANELPVVDELAEVESMPLQTKPYSTTATPYPSRFSSPARCKPFVVASDRGGLSSWTADHHIASPYSVSTHRPSVEALRISMLRSSLSNGMCTSWALDDE